jgi:hypothetical protein
MQEHASSFGTGGKIGTNDLQQLHAVHKYCICIWHRDTREVQLQVAKL